jgi:hypothetical protein
MFVSKLSAFTKSIGARKFLIWVALVCTAPLFCLLTDLWQHPSFISGGLAMRIMAASLIAKGELPYFDFWDWTQPIVFELLKYPYLLSSALESLRLPLVPVYSIFIPQCIFCMIVASLILATSVCVQALHSQVKTPATGGTDGLPTEDLEYQDQRAQDFAVPCLLGFVLTMLIARYDFGELQYLLLLTLVPWLLLRWFAHQGLRVRAKLAAFTGVVAGVGACFDVPFVAIFIILELILTLRSGRWRALLSIEWLAFLLTIGINLLVLTHMDEAVSKAFWQWTMPLKLLNYSLVDPTIYAPLSCPKRVDVLYGMVAAGIIAFLLGRKHSFFAPLMALMLVGLGLYMLEGQGFSHDLILTIFASTTTFACALSMASKNWSIGWAKKHRASNLISSTDS